jgi:protein SCO1/2
MLGQRSKVKSQVQVQVQGKRRVQLRACLLVVLAAALGLSDASAQQQPGLPGSMGFTGGIVASNVPPQFKEVTFAQRLDTRLPLEATFRDEQGRTVALGDFFGERPVLLSFVYYQCPLLCSQVMNGISSALKVTPFTPGEDFDVVLISFDPRDTPEAANAKKRAHLLHWDRQDTAAGWHFLTGDEATIRQVTSAAGFNYTWDEQTKQFAHVSGILAVTPDGRLSRYFYGVEYSPKELRLALVESGAGKIGSAVDELLLYCFQYDPESGRYGVVVMNVIRLAGLLTVGLIAGFILLMRRRESGRPAPTARGGDHGPRPTVERHA